MRITRICALLFLLPALAAEGAELKIAAAADLQFVVSQLVGGFERQTGTTARVSYGSSGNFFAQIQNGAPFDVFLSADVDYPRRLVAAGLADPAFLRVYARGALVLWTSRKDLDLSRLGMKALLDASVRRVAIANPEHAPYGRAAVAALRHFGVYDRVRDKLVLGENISQAAQFADLGNADLGLLAMSLALAPRLRDHGAYWVVPEDAYPPLEQGVVVVKSSRATSAARKFVEYLKSSAAQEVLRQYGFQPPRGAQP